MRTCSSINVQRGSGASRCCHVLIEVVGFCLMLTVNLNWKALKGRGNLKVRLAIEYFYWNNCMYLASWCNDRIVPAFWYTCGWWSSLSSIFHDLFIFATSFHLLLSSYQCMFRPVDEKGRVLALVYKMAVKFRAGICHPVLSLSL